MSFQRLGSSQIGGNKENIEESKTIDTVETASDTSKINSFIDQKQLRRL
jgi:hypothetical protein